ncbi:hypothetical protein HOLleu_40713 [Holothuria leucospilota]|uniref:Uncharacterized protein n=1 Tax=Holothuria leucospilota TaxID=206669 RepID=A0A9Q0YI16_HOLLE|nr:hypothetical protein HOLleu_40713 [Holothuria leucospilota]
MAPPASPSLAEGPASKRTAHHPSASNARAPLPARNPASVRPLSRPSPAKGLAPPLQSPLRSSISALGKDDVSSFICDHMCPTCSALVDGYPISGLKSCNSHPQVRVHCVLQWVPRTAYPWGKEPMRSG